VHHVEGNVAIAFVGGVGDHDPAVALGLGGGVADGVVVVAGHPHHLGAVAGDGGAPSLADRGVHEDHAAAAEQAGAPGHGASVVAVGGAGHGDGRDDVAILAGQDVRR